MKKFTQKLDLDKVVTNLEQIKEFKQCNQLVRIEIIFLILILKISTLFLDKILI